MSTERRRTRDILAEKGQLLLEKLHITTPRTTNVGLEPHKEGWDFGSRRQGESPVQEKKPPGRRVLGKEFVPEVATVPEALARKAGVQPKMWDESEDELLRLAVEKYGDQDWKLIASEVPGRSHLQCLQRWKKALRPGLVKGHWTAEEDAKLLSLLKYTQNWQEISNAIPGRNPKQCRERWFLNLDPSINHGPWTPEEDENLMELQQQLGSKWALISKQMPGRTENAVKTRFHTLERQQVRERGWFRWEDRVLIEFCLENGRQWAQLVKLLQGRSKGQVKKRYLTLMQEIPQLAALVEVSESNITNGISNPKAKARALELIPMGTLDQEQAETMDGSLTEKTKSFRVPPSSKKGKSTTNDGDQPYHYPVQQSYNNPVGSYNQNAFQAAAAAAAAASQTTEPRKKLVHQKGSSWLDDLEAINEEEASRPPKLVRTKSMELFENLFNDDLSAAPYVPPNFQSTNYPLATLSPSNMQKQSTTQQRLSKKATSHMVLEQLLNSTDMLGIVSPSHATQEKKSLTNYASSWLLNSGHGLLQTNSGSFGAVTNLVPELKNHSSSNSLGEERFAKQGSLNLDDIFSDHALV